MGDAIYKHSEGISGERTQCSLFSQSQTLASQAMTRHYDSTSPILQYIYKINKKAS